MKRYQSAYVTCPFYHSEDSQKIYCEGVTEENYIHLAFGDSKHKLKYEKEHCCKFYMKCKIAQMLNSKYSED